LILYDMILDTCILHPCDLRPFLSNLGSGWADRSVSASEANLYSQIRRMLFPL